MTPDTIHLLAQFIRHNRGTLTAFDKWVEMQPSSSTCRELIQIIAVARGILNDYEKQLSQYEVTTDIVAKR